MAAQNARRGLTAAGVLLLVVAPSSLAQNAAARAARRLSRRRGRPLPAAALRAARARRSATRARRRSGVHSRRWSTSARRCEQKGEYRWLDNYLDTITHARPAAGRRPIAGPAWRRCTTAGPSPTTTVHDVEPLPRAAACASSPTTGSCRSCSAATTCSSCKPDDPKAARRVPAHRRRVGPPRRHRRWRAVVGAASGRDHHAPGGAGGGGGAPPRGGLRLDAGRAARATRCATGSCRCTPRSTSSARSASARPSRRRGSATLPYVPADLFVAIGPPRPARMDVAALSPLGSDAQRRSARRA